MTILSYLQSLEPEERAELLGGREWGLLNLEKLSLKEACGLVSLCPMTVGYALFEDDRSCDKTGNCRTCTRRFLALEMPEEYL